MHRTHFIIAAVLIVLAGGGGYWLGSSSHAQSVPNGRSAGGAGQFTGRAGGGSLGSGGAVFGAVIAKDATSITVQLGGPNASSTNGGATGTKIVLYNTSTQVGEFTTGSTNDLKVGQDVLVNGTPNSDGSLTAQMIQVRPAGAGPRIGG